MGEGREGLEVEGRGGTGVRGTKTETAFFLGPRPAPEEMLKWVKGASASRPQGSRTQAVAKSPDPAPPCLTPITCLPPQASAKGAVPTELGQWTLELPQGCAFLDETCP